MRIWYTVLEWGEATSGMKAGSGTAVSFTEAVLILPFLHSIMPK